MHPLRTEREIWQATVTFVAPGEISPAVLARFLGQLNTIFPVEPREVSWQMPAFNAGMIQFQLGPGGPTSVVPDFLIGASPRGWNLQLSSKQLVVRHQQTLKNEENGKHSRQAGPSDFPTEAEFCRVAQTALRLLPSELLENVRIRAATASYVVPCSDAYPGDVIAGALFERPLKPGYMPRDDTRYIIGVQEQFFETVSGHRYVWNDITRMARWFGAEGYLLENAAVAKSTEIKTASPEPKTPTVGVYPIEAMPALPADETLAFFSDDQAGGLPRALRRLKAQFEPQVVFNV